MSRWIIVFAIVCGGPAWADELELIPSRPSEPAKGTEAGLLAGLSLFGAAYTPIAYLGGSALAYGRAGNDASLLLLPVVGAFVVGGEAIASSYPAQANYTDRAYADIGRVFGAGMIIDGCGQVAGLALALVSGLRMHRAVDSRLTVSPTASRGVVGLAAIGRF